MIMWGMILSLHVVLKISDFCVISLPSNPMHRPPGSNIYKWFKFDDGEVTEAKIDDDEVR